jgi:undecaprenyl-diphosphatase
MYQLDSWVSNAINASAGANGSFDYLMLAITKFGVPLLVLAVVLQWWPRQDRDRVRHVLVAAGFSFIIGLAINQLILLGVHRPRPYLFGITHLIIEPSTDPSFPSDHATAAAAIAAGFLLHRFTRRGLAFMGGALLVGVSRVYVGTHYASDVLGGAAIGILAAAIVLPTYRAGTPVDRFLTNLL